jgi:3-methyladenine DNA glycosylase AlkD
MNRGEMRALATRCRDQLLVGEVTRPLERVKDVVSARTPFRQLDLCGQVIAQAAHTSPVAFSAFLEGLAHTREIGAWPLVGSALAAAFLTDDLPHAFAEARRFILLANVWHAADAIAERVLGEGLRTDFSLAFQLLASWREAEDAWLRRAVGVAVHRYAKRERDRADRAGRLLQLLAPLLEERDTSALKGVGWGLKTLGRYYPDLLVPWLREQLATRCPRRLMVRKAITYLPEAIKAEFV